VQRQHKKPIGAEGDDMTGMGEVNLPAGRSGPKQFIDDCADTSIR